MPKETKTSRVVWLRRIVQTGFLILFFCLFLQTAYHPINRVGGRVTLFFEFDPLAMLVVWLASHALVAAMLLSLVTLGVTLVFGRWFCGWICPFGTLHHFFTVLRGGRVKAKIEAGGYSRWQNAKYYVLVFFVACALIGSNAVGWLDPFSFFYRSLTTSVYPAIQWGIATLFGWIYDVNPGVGSVRLTAVTEPVYAALREYFLALEQPRYFGGMLIGVLFGVVVALNFFRARFWCRYVCPLGALLGAVGARPVVRFKNDPDQCNNCGLCLADCQGGASPNNPQGWNASECFFCFNCKSDCPSAAISVGFSRPPKSIGLDLGRRALLGAGIAGIGGGLLFRSHPRAFNPALIRPPGAIAEDEFLTRCIRCGECMKVCLTNGIHPTLAEAGLQGMWSPVLNMRIGYCEYECTLCSQVCPTHAIKQVTPQEKKRLKIGLAFIDKNRCLPYALARSCIVCEEHCPTPKKAIWFEEVAVRNIRGETVVVKQPHVDPELCIGCGICENKCPVKDLPAVRVTSVGETRNRDNQVLL